MKNLMKKQKENKEVDMLNPFKDQVTIGLNAERESVNTYYNGVNKTLDNNKYQNLVIDNNNNFNSIIRDKSLSIIFHNRVKFMIQERLDHIQNYMHINNMLYISVYSSDVIDNIERQLPQIFNLDSYIFMGIDNPIAATDLSLALNSILYNSLYNSIYGFSFDNNPDDIKEQIMMITNLMNITILEWVQMLNLLYLEANDIYANNLSQIRELGNNNE